MAYTYKYNALSGEFDIVQDTSLLTMKGVVDTTGDLPLTGNSENDVYIVKADDKMYTWNKATPDGILSDWVDIGSITSIDWSIITNKPTSVVGDIDLAVTHKDLITNPHLVTVDQLDLASGTVASDIDDAINKKHTQNTDIILTTDGTIALINAGVLKTDLQSDLGTIINIGEIKARDGNGLQLNDDAGNPGILIADTGMVIVPTINGIDYTPGSDTDVDLITVNVTGTPKLWWDEATDSFEFNKSLTIPGGSLNIGGVTLTEDGGCLKTSDFHAHGDGSVAGYYKLHHGTTPSADAEAEHSILWVDSSGNLHFQNATGNDSNSFSVSRSIIPTTDTTRATINFGGGGSLIGAIADTDALFLANAYYNEGYKYLTSDLASAIKLDNGEITLSTAISGTADNAISWKDVINIAVGKVFINETSNAKMTQGLTINQGANDDEILALKSSDVNHSMTNIAESDTYFSLKKLDAGSGGANIRGLSDADQPGLVFQGIMGTATPTKSNPAIKFQGIKYNGDTGAGALADDETVLAVQNGGTVVLTVKGNGDTTVAGGLNVGSISEYADNDDAKIAGALTIGAFYRTGDLLKVVH